MEKRKRSLRRKESDNDYMPSDEEVPVDKEDALGGDSEQASSSHSTASGAHTRNSAGPSGLQDENSTGGESVGGMPRRRSNRRSKPARGISPFIVDSDSLEDASDDEVTSTTRLKKRPRNSGSPERKKRAKHWTDGEDASEFSEGESSITHVEDAKGSTAGDEEGKGSTAGDEPGPSNAGRAVSGRGGRRGGMSRGGRGGRASRGGRVAKVEQTESTVPVVPEKESSEEKAGEENSDNYCWVCHKEGEVMLCSFCARVYHKACMLLDTIPDGDWMCPECEGMIAAEDAQKMPKIWRDVSQESFVRMLVFMLDKLSQQSHSLPFRQPVDPIDAPVYKDYIVHPMDISTLRKSVENNEFGSCEAFLGEFKWIYHNCVVFNGSNTGITAHAKTLINACKLEVNELRGCPDCYMAKTEAHASGRRDPDWFSKPCRVAHPLVWIHFRNCPLWPAKVLVIDGKMMLTRFFGDYDTTTVSTGTAYMHAEYGFPKHVLFSSKKSAYPHFKEAYEELERHVVLLKERFPDFQLPPVKQDFSMVLVNRYYTCIGETSRTVSDNNAVTPASRRSSRDSLISEQTGVSSPALGAVSYQKPGSSKVKRISDTKTRLQLSKQPAPGQTPTEDRVLPPVVEVEDSSTPNAAQGASEVQAMEVDSPAPLPSCESAGFVAGETEPMEAMEEHESEEKEVQCAGRDVDKANILSLFSKLEDHICRAVASFREEVLGTTSGAAAEPAQVIVPPTETPVTVPNSDIPAILTNITDNKDMMSLPLKDIIALASQMTSSGPVDETKEDPPVAGGDDSVEIVEDGQEPGPSTTTAGPPNETAPGSPKKKKKRHRQSGSEVEEANSSEAREVRRLRVLCSLQKLEMVHLLEQQVQEMRQVFDIEKRTLLEDARKVWENEMIQMIDAAKKKQWCSQCGREAFYYCCWNTCYCDNECQERHWPSHMTTCAQNRNKTSTYRP